MRRSMQAIRKAAWYRKSRPTFADALAVVRKELWAQEQTFCGSPSATDTVKVPRAFVERLTDAVCYAASMAKVEVERLSEKGRKSLRCSLMDHRNGTFRPIFASPHRLNPRFEGCSYPFSDSLGRGILRSTCRNNHNGASERGFAVCVILCAPEGP